MMKRIFVTLGFLVLFVCANPAKAWSYWYYQQFPYTPPMRLHQQLPYDYGQPFWFYHQYPSDPFQSWATPEVAAGLYMEQLQLRNGYGVRVFPGARGRQDIIVGIGDGTLLVRTHNAQSPIAPGGADRMQRFGWMSQWVALPADADTEAMGMALRNGVLEIFIPRL